jgi:nucleotide-binding universal stress UspA family protein
MYNHILVPIDGSQQSDQALDHAIKLVKHISPNARITVIHVSPLLILNEPPISVPLSETLAEEGQNIVEPAAAKLMESRIAFKSVTLTGDPSTTICHQAEIDGHDLIVMGCRGVGLMSEILLGSVSHGVIKHANCPVLIIK